jgi:hypothetical protein
VLGDIFVDSHIIFSLVLGAGLSMRRKAERISRRQSNVETTVHHNIRGERWQLSLECHLIVHFLHGRDAGSLVNE